MLLAVRARCWESMVMTAAQLWGVKISKGSKHCVFHRDDENVFVMCEIALSAWELMAVVQWIDL